METKTRARQGDVIEVQLVGRSMPVTAVVLACNGEGSYFIDIVDEPQPGDLPIMCGPDEVVSVRVFDPAALVDAA